MEHKTLPFEVTALDAPGRTLEGYAAVFGNVDAVGDIIHPGAFRKTLAERGHLLKFLWQHEPKEPIGKIVECREDLRGLFVKAIISETARGRDALALLKDGAISGMSIGYDAVKGGTDYSAQGEQNVRNLREIKLYEASVVTFPANPEANVTALKEQGELTEPKPVDVDENSIRVQPEPETKAGRMISAANHAKLKAALREITDILSAAGLDAADDDEPKAAPAEQVAETKGEAGPGEPPTSEIDVMLIDVELQQLRTLMEV